MGSKRITALLVAALVVLTLLAPSALASGVTVRLAQQYGMQYAPVYVAQELKLIEKYMPGVTLEWTKLGGGSAINEALIAGKLDVAFMGIPPALIAIDKGVDYRIASGVCVPPAQLMVRADAVKSLAELGPEDRIAVPGVGSIQHIMLSIAAEKELGNAKAFDNSIVAMANPDAYTALISGTDIVGHFASMPYIDLETTEGMVSVLSAPIKASIVCVTTKAIHENAEVEKAIQDALSEAIDLINKGDPEALKIIAATEKITEEQAAKYTVWPGTIYAPDVYGVQTLSDFMQKNGYIQNVIAAADACWPGVTTVD
jgi:NitT/TauT family transport system substrate-binding protein